MSTNTRSQRFADALQALEQGDEKAMLEQFSEGAELQRPEHKQDQDKSEDAPTFWKQYMEQFERIGTEFDRVVEGGDEGILEWRSTGVLATGRDIAYAGVSLLTFEGDSVTRFATYYDTAAFIAPTE